MPAKQQYSSSTSAKQKVLKVTQVPNDKNLIVDNQNVENVQDFNYLGAIFTNKVDDDTKKVRQRITMAKTAMIVLTNIWKDSSFHNAQRNNSCKLWYSQ